LFKVKQFDNFTDMVDWDLSDEKITLDLSGGEKWRALRKALSPTFSSGKLKGMLDLMDTSVDNLVDHLSKAVKKNPVVELKSVFQAFALDTIAACAFGVNTNSHANESNAILDNGRKLFSVFQTKSVIDDLFQLVTGLFPFIISYFGIYTSAYDNLYNITK
jgi:cytochrome P450 family 6